MPEDLDFSGSEQSWFDLYHLHIDDLGVGNSSWKARKQHLDALFELAKCVREKLIAYPKNYQFWIEVDESDSREDAIYIHTPNPNEDNFPIRLGFDEGLEVKNNQLLRHLEEKDYLMEKKIMTDADGRVGITYFLYKKELGMGIEC